MSYKHNSTSQFAIFHDWTLDQRSGGPPGYLANLKVGLENQNKESEVDFITRDLLNENSLRSAPPKKFFESVNINDSARAFSEFASNPNNIFVHSHYFPVLKANLRRIIHAHTTMELLALHNTLCQLGERHKIQLVLTSHSPQVPALERASGFYDQGASSEVSEKVYLSALDCDYMAFHYADAVIFPSKESIEPYMSTMPGFETAFSQKPTYFVPTGANKIEPTRSRSDLRDNYECGDDFVVSYIGRHTSIKGYDVLANVGFDFLNSFNNTKILVGGKTGPLQAPDHPKWLECGWTKSPANIICASDVFVLPNKHTYFDLVMIEALSTGIPIIASKTGGNKYFSDKCEGVFLYNTENELFELLLKLKNMSNNERVELGFSNQNFYENNLTVDKFALNYLSAINSIYSDLKSGNQSILDSHEFEQDLVSVIIPIYNDEKTVDECINSVTNQTYSHIEIILVDDGSTDTSSEIMNKHGEVDKRIKIINRRRGGLGAARNSGLDVARGKFVMFVDPSDALNENSIEILIHICNEHNVPIAACGIERIDDNSQTIHQDDGLLNSQIIYKFLSGYICKVNSQTVASINNNSCTKIYKRSAFNSMRFREGLLYEDYIFHYELFLSIEQFGYTSDPIYKLRQSNSTRIPDDEAQRVLDVFTVFDLVASMLQSGHFSDREYAAEIKLLIRMIWERYRNVQDMILRYQLLEKAKFRLDKIDCDYDRANKLKDDFVPVSFINDIYHETSVRDYRLPAKYIWPVGDRVSVNDRTNTTQQVDVSLVVFNESDKSVLVHPHNGGITTAEFTGLGTYKTFTLMFEMSLESKKAKTGEFRIAISDFGLTNDQLLNLNSPQILKTYDWQDLESEDRKSIEMRIDDPTLSMCLYIQTRMKDDESMYFNWTTASNFRIQY